MKEKQPLASGQTQHWQLWLGLLLWEINCSIVHWTRPLCYKGRTRPQQDLSIIMSECRPKTAALVKPQKSNHFPVLVSMSDSCFFINYNFILTLNSLPSRQDKIPNSGVISIHWKQAIQSKALKPCFKSPNKSQNSIMVLAYSYIPWFPFVHNFPHCKKEQTQCI